jgi:Ni/Co efflux regulator RcnB
MKKILIAASAVATMAPMAMPAPALALDHGRRDIRREQRECDRELRRADSHREYRQELKECRKEIAREQREYRRDHRRSYYGGYRNNGGYYDRSRYDRGYAYGGSPYYADRYYRDGRYYDDRTIGYGDTIYRGADNRYYCRRNDGTTGLIVGAGLGALLGNQINLGGSKTVSTIVGGAAGAVIGRAIDKGSVRCD